MKRIIFIVAIVALIGFSSCQKSYMCTCTSTGITNDSLYWRIGNQQIEASSHKHAQDACNAWQTSEQNEANAIGGGTVKCSL